MSSGQVLKEAYEFAKARIVVREMADALSLDLVSRRMKTDQLVHNDREERTDRRTQGMMEKKSYDDVISSVTEEMIKSFDE